MKSKKYTILILSNLWPKNNYDGIIIAVAHDIFRELGINFILNLCKKTRVIYDLKYLFKSDKVDLRL